ncbi:hypothetical protein C2G38_2236358 [Gigaspora rosea]|uniref:Uncharacterized protein n=1 Tax=Gigaspora rosea TaxID=44941 RepID=A0A397TSP8_9GLOM|nr:hypothetical protein C2G38_2236358 [Gigaspora rosea]
MQIRSHKVPINTRNTPSTTKKFTKKFFLNHAKNCGKKIFGQNRLFWSIQYNNFTRIFKYGDFVQYLSCELLQYGRIQSFVIKDNLIKVQMQQLLPYSRIPQNLYSLECELQTQEWLLDQLQPPLFDISVNDVLYYFYGSWKCRPIKFQNRHQSEYISTYPPPNSTMPVLKFFLDLYYDDFDRNIQDFIKPFIEEVKKLEQGFIINLNGVDHWVMGGLGVVTSSLISGTLRLNMQGD